MTDFSKLVEEEYCYNCRKYVSVTTEEIKSPSSTVWVTKCSNCGYALVVHEIENDDKSK